MQVTKEKIFRLGIDKISLKGFQFEANEEFEKTVDKKKDSIKEEITIKDEIFSLKSTYVIYQEDGELKDNIYNHITFNPNKILTGDNVCNSTVNDLQEAILKLQDFLKEKGVKVDFSNSKIADIEININIPYSFDEYWEVFLLFFKPYSYKAKAIEVMTDSDKFEEFMQLESFFLPLSNSVTFKLYSKDREKKLLFPCSRLEYYLKSSAYKYDVEKYGYTDSLLTLLENPKILRLIFIERFKKDFGRKIFDYIERELKPLLEKKYLAFKEANKLAREKGRKEERDVYKYLDQFWIFDYSFLIELIEKHEKKNKKREKERVIKKFSKKNNLSSLNAVLERVLNS